MKSLALIAVLTSGVFALPLSIRAELILDYEFTTDCYPTSIASHISNTQAFNDRYTSSLSRVTDHGNPAPAAIADYWRSVYNNYWYFRLTVDSGYALRLDSIQFDSQSDTYGGPTSYDVRYSTDGSTFTSICGGWQSISADNQWYFDLTADNGGSPIENQTGAVYFRIYGSNPTYGGQYHYWSLDNVRVNGQVALVPVVSVPGDTNNDGIVDEYDARVLAARWGTKVSGRAADGDFNSDGVVNAADASILAANWGYVASESTAIPEPFALFLLITGSVATMHLRGRRQWLLRRESAVRDH